MQPDREADMCDEVFYTIEKLPYRKRYALCRTVHGKNGNTCEPFAYFRSVEHALLAKKELAK